MKWKILDKICDVIGITCIVLSVVIIICVPAYYKAENIKLKEQVEQLQNKELSCKSYCEIEFEKMGC